MVRRLLVAAVFFLSVWMVGAHAQDWFVADQAAVARSDASCTVTSSHSRTPDEGRWDVVGDVASLGTSVWRIQPDDADTPAVGFADNSRAAVFVARRLRSPHVPPHLHDIPLLI